MSSRAKFIMEVVVLDPDSGGKVHVSMYKHENGGIFGIDSSYLDQVLEDDEIGLVYDPFADMGHPEGLYLEE